MASDITWHVQHEVPSMPKSIPSRSAKKDWAKPYGGFPLSYHPPSGRVYKVLRKARQDKGPRMFEAHELRAMINAAPLQLRTMILLGVNGGYGIMATSRHDD